MCAEHGAGFRSLKILVDNRAAGGLASEHGFAVLIEAGGRSILMDTGQHDALEKNAAALGIRLSHLDALVLSHGHYDHTGAVDYVLAENPEVRVYAHPKIFSRRFSLYPDRVPKEISMPPEERVVAANLPDSQLQWIREPTEIAPGVWLTGPIPRRHPLEDTGGPFFIDPEGREADPIEDDMALWIETPKGLLVVCGCCHSGLVNTLNYVREVSGRPIWIILGGLHLKSASEARLAASADAVNGFGPARVVPCHCTGEAAVDYFRRHLKAETLAGYTGFELTLEN